MQIEQILKDKYILCFCEGSAELDIMNMLLEEDLLIFAKDDLVDGKFHKRESASEAQINWQRQSRSIKESLAVAI